MAIKCIANGSDFRGVLNVDVVQNANARALPRHFGQARPKFLSGGTHQAGMKGCRNGQKQRALSPLGFEQFTSLINTCFAAGNDGLFGIVEVGSFHHLTAVLDHFLAPITHALRVQTQDGRHSTHADGNGLLHGLRAKTHQRQGICQRERTGCHQRGVLTQRMSGDHRGLSTSFMTPRAVASDTSGQHDGLRVGGEVEFFFGAAANQRGHILP